MKYIIFDFNGTILDDVEVGIKAENMCIAKYLDRPPLTREEYLNNFTFPIKEYNERIGYDFSKVTYEQVSEDWFKNYCSLKNEYKVFDGVIDKLIESHNLGYKNIIISASETTELKKQLIELDIEQYFDEVLGTSDIYAGSKVQVGINWMKGKNPDDCMFIGDSLHDLETAQGMGIKNCVLVSKGHQAKEILKQAYDNVVDDISEVKLCE